MSARTTSFLIAIALAGGCTALSASSDGPSSENPFSAAERQAQSGKFDTGWLSSEDATEVELDVEGDVESPSGYWNADAPLQIGQFALSYLRDNSGVFVQSLAEDYSHGLESVEWLVNGEWTRGDAPGLSEARPTHFRMHGVSAVVLNPGTDEALLAREFPAVVPTRPSTLYADVGDKCGDTSGHIGVSQDVYWYVWKPNATRCPASAKQTVTLEVSRVLPRGVEVYPEYDRLLLDNEITAVVFFGQVDDGEISDSDWSFELIRAFEGDLEGAGFTKAATAPLGARWVREANAIRVVVDVYGPREFSGLTDYAHVATFDEGVRAHEIVVWNGHSVLGGSDFWARPQIYAGDAASKYQIFLYQGCLGYEYYVNPILAGKQSWDNVDLVSKTVSGSFSAMPEVTSSTIGLIVGGAEAGGTTSWNTILGKLNAIAVAEGIDAHWGASGIRTNRFRPQR